MNSEAWRDDLSEDELEAIDKFDDSDEDDNFGLADVADSDDESWSDWDSDLDGLEASDPYTFNRDASDSGDEDDDEDGRAPKRHHGRSRRLY